MGNTFSQGAAKGDSEGQQYCRYGGNAEGNQELALNGTVAFSNVAEHLRVQTIDGDTFVIGDPSGDGTSDTIIRFISAVPLVAGNFAL